MSGSSIRMVADESVDAAIIEGLRKGGFDVYSMSEKQPSVSDDNVLSVATTHAALRITEDKDFGELVVRLRKQHYGIRLVRLAGIPSTEKSGLVGTAVQQHFLALQHSFSVLDRSKLRIRNLK
ncbi:MAG: DUF5615 family PIN-like protein [Chitinophagales bacterium]|nr:DUF5615 family PIN-like protein [Chitinophagales bacterium]